MPAYNRTHAFGNTADLCPYNGIWQMVDRGNADGNKRPERMARHAGKTLLQTAHNACHRTIPLGAKDFVLPDGNCIDLRTDDNGGGSVADILPAKGGNIFLVFGMLHAGRGVPVAGYGERYPAEDTGTQF